MSAGDWWTSQTHADQKEWPKGRVHGWAPGNYSCTCRDCGIHYAGDKRSVQCYPCAAKFVPPPRPETIEEIRADRDRLAAELARVQGEVRRAWGRAAALWDGYDALKDFLDDESEDARDRGYSHLADHFQERVIEARQTLSRHPRPREDQLNFAALAQPQDGTTDVEEIPARG